jgi:hypothetical protein
LEKGEVIFRGVLCKGIDHNCEEKVNPEANPTMVIISNGIFGEIKETMNEECPIEVMEDAMVVNREHVHP